MARRSTRKGGYRKTARRAYTGLRRRTRRTRRRVYYAARRRTRRSATGLMRGQSGRALKECAWITAGSALGMATARYAGATVIGQPTDVVVGAGAIAWGVYKNDAKPIYLGFGALFPRINVKMAEILGLT